MYNLLQPVMAYKTDAKKELQKIEFHIYNRNFELLGMLSNYTSMVWTEEYFGRGEFMLACVDSVENIKLLQENNYIIRKDKNTAMIIKYVKYDSTEKSRNSSLIVRGFTTLTFLDQETIYKTEQIHNVEQGMYKIVANHKNRKPIENATSKNLPDIFATQFTGNNVLDAITTLGVATDIGFKMIFDVRNKKHIFNVYKGRDLTYQNKEGNPQQLFSEENGKLLNTIIIKDNSVFRNAVDIAGGGEGSDRIWIRIEPEGLDPLDIYRLFIDARDLQKKEEQTQTEYEELLKARGIERLNQHIRVETFKGEVDPQGFGSDFDLGDKITSDSKRYGVRLNTRILRYSEIRENNMTKLELTLGQPEIIRLGEI